MLWSETNHIFSRGYKKSIIFCLWKENSYKRSGLTGRNRTSLKYLVCSTLLSPNLPVFIREFPLGTTCNVSWGVSWFPRCLWLPRLVWRRPFARNGDKRLGYSCLRNGGGFLFLNILEKYASCEYEQLDVVETHARNVLGQTRSSGVLVLF